MDATVTMSLKEYNEMRDQLLAYEDTLKRILNPTPTEFDISYTKDMSSTKSMALHAQFKPTELIKEIVASNLAEHELLKNEDYTHLFDDVSIYVGFAQFPIPENEAPKEV